MRRALLAFMTLIIFPVSLILIIIWTTLLSVNNPTTLKNIINKDNSYSKIINILPAYLTQSDNSPIIFDNEQKTRIIKAGIPESYLKTNIDQIVNDFFSWINNKKSTFAHTIDLTKAKDNAKDEIITIYKEKYASLAECTSGELLLNKMQNTHQFPTCRIPSESAYESIYKSFDATIATTDSINSFPDKIEIPIPSNLQNIPKLFSQFRLLLMIATIIDLFLFTLCLYILRMYPKKLLRYISTISLSLGIIIFGFKYFLLETGINYFNENISDSLNKNAELKSIILPIYQSVAANIKNDFYLISLALIGLGIFFCLINLFIKNKKSITHETIDIKPASPQNSSKPQPKNPQTTEYILQDPSESQPTNAPIPKRNKPQSKRKML